MANVDWNHGLSTAVWDFIKEAYYRGHGLEKVCGEVRACWKSIEVEEKLAIEMERKEREYK